MATTQSLKRRIKSAKSIKQITKAMEMVAASKMRRAQQQALSSRPYSRKLEEVLATVSALSDTSLHPLFQTNAKGVDLYVIFSTDKSMAGSLNTNLFRGIQEYLSINSASKESDNQQFVIVGQKARQFIHANNSKLIADFSGIPDPVRFHAAVPIAQYLINGYLNHEFKSVTLLYMDFISTLVQKFRPLQLLPFRTSLTNSDNAFDEGTKFTSQTEYLFEPNPKEIFDWLLPYYIEMIVFQTLLESKASEHSARMVSMKNASENATEIINELTLSYNKQRQAKITSELLDNSTAALVVS